MKFLVDANVLSEATKPRPALAVVEWLRQHEADLAVNPIIVGELQYGILLVASARRRARLLKWLAEGVVYLPMLDLDGTTAKVWAELLARLKRKGRAMPVKDSLIAATALQHGLTVATRNSDDFRHAGVRIANPFAPAR